MDAFRGEGDGRPHGPRTAAGRIRLRADNKSRANGIRNAMIGEEIAISSDGLSRRDAPRLTGFAAEGVSRAATDVGPVVRLTGVSVSYGGFRALRPLDLDIHTGDFLAILGPSGCGKTTLLRLVGGFLPPTSGRIEIGGVDVTALGPERRPTNTVFQGYGLFPHMSVRQNIGYGLKLRKLPKAEITRETDRASGLVQLTDLLDRRIDQLSGGQQQRVALARAIVMRPKVLLLDEPLAALDLKLRHVMQQELRRIHREIGGTFIFVTHDQGEALALANRIAIMNEGALMQDGTADEIYRKPANRFVATFIGEANIIRGERRNGTASFASGVPSQASVGPDGAVELVLRPEAIRIAARDDGSWSIPARVTDLVFLGSFVRYALSTGAGNPLTAVQTAGQGLQSFKIGDGVHLSWDLATQHLLEVRK